ncbi:hypothetical protein H8356DRAFT_1657159 [Neocallimastix lanati (nom. inval.)]|nr:hypothetical protein H8356DRAFT_1657159 [Neocallimastix sp. JGI-2020a]
MDCFGFGDCCGGKKNNKIGIEENINNSGIYPSGHYVHNTQYVNPAMPNMYNNTNAYYYGNMNQNVPYPLSDGYLPNNFYTTTAKPTSLKPKPAQYNNNLPNKITTTTTTTTTKPTKPASAPPTSKPTISNNTNTNISDNPYINGQYANSYYNSTIDQKPGTPTPLEILLQGEKLDLTPPSPSSHSAVSNSQSVPPNYQHNGLQAYYPYQNYPVQQLSISVPNSTSSSPINVPISYDIPHSSMPMPMLMPIPTDNQEEIPLPTSMPMPIDNQEEIPLPTSMPMPIDNQIKIPLPTSMPMPVGSTSTNPSSSTNKAKNIFSKQNQNIIK